MIRGVVFETGTRQDVEINATSYSLTTRYQPIVELASDITIGFEVLSKIESETFFDPETFFARLDKVTFIDVVRQQIECVNRFYDQRVLGCNLLFFFNIRLSFLISQEFTYLISHVAKFRLAFEIDFMDAMSFKDADVMESITLLLDCGHEVWLDDYDGGELNQLVETIPWSGIKIDKSFLWKYTMDYKKLEAVLSSTLLVGRKTIVEGIETYQQRELCLQTGFMSGQGFYWPEYIE